MVQLLISEPTMIYSYTEMRSTNLIAMMIKEHQKCSVDNKLAHEFFYN